MIFPYTTLCRSLTAADRNFALFGSVDDLCEEIAKDFQLIIIEAREFLADHAAHDRLAELQKFLACAAQAMGRRPALPLLADDKPAIDEPPRDCAKCLIGLKGRLRERMGRGAGMRRDPAKNDPLCETALELAQRLVHSFLLAVLRLFQQQADFTDVTSGQSDVFQCPVRSLLPWNGMWHPIPSLMAGLPSQAQNAFPNMRTGTHSTRSSLLLIGLGRRGFLTIKSCSELAEELIRQLPRNPLDHPRSKLRELAANGDIGVVFKNGRVRLLAGRELDERTPLGVADNTTLTGTGEAERVRLVHFAQFDPTFEGGLDRADLDGDRRPVIGLALCLQIAAAGNALAEHIRVKDSVPDLLHGCVELVSACQVQSHAKSSCPLDPIIRGCLPPPFRRAWTCARRSAHV